LRCLIASVALQVIATHADLIADEFVAELERIELVLQRIDRIQRIGVFDPLADVENGGRRFAGLLRRDPARVGVDRRRSTRSR
jgi:hypothetical protein